MPTTAFIVKADTEAEAIAIVHLEVPKLLDGYKPIEILHAEVKGQARTLNIDATLWQVNVLWANRNHTPAPETPARHMMVYGYEGAMGVCQRPGCGAPEGAAVHAT
jgi:hypothetical protein